MKENNSTPRLIIAGSEILDLSLAFKNDDLTLVRLRDDSKIPLDSNWQNGISKEVVSNHTGNLGAIVGKPFVSDGGRSHIFVVDIDLEPEAAQFFAGVLMSKVADDCIMIETASGKVQLWFRVEGYLSDGVHDFFNDFIVSDIFQIPEYRNKPIPKGKIEEFGGNKDLGARQVVLVGSTINGNSYHVSRYSKNNKIYDLPIIRAEDLRNNLEFALLDNGFKLNTETDSSEAIEKEANVGFVSGKIHDVPTYLIEQEAVEILRILEANDGAKHYIYLALGNFYANRAHITKDSVIKIHERILELNPTLFKNNGDALKTLLKGFNNNNDDKQMTGARHIFEEYVHEFESKQEFWFKRFKFTHNTTKYFPAGQIGKKFNAIVENPYTKQIELHKIRVKQKKDGTETTYTEEAIPVLGLEIVEIERIQNTIIPSANDSFRFSFIASGRNKIQIIDGSTFKEIQDKLKSKIGIVLGGNFSHVFNQIISFYTRNNLIKVSKTAPVPGIFEMDGELRRFDYDLKEIEPGYSKEKLINAVDLLEQIRDILPTDSNKFGSIIADGLVLPLNFILKKHGNMAKYLIFLGAGRTWKSTIGEMLVNFYNETRINSINGNIFKAGSFASEYQVGIKFGISSYAFVVDEVAKSFNDENIMEILKSAIESNIARSTADGIYYSFSTPILTSNVDIPQTDAMLRRSNTYYFTPAERLSEDDIDDLADLLNVSGTNSRFRELAAIGDFVFTFLHDNLDLLKTLNTDELKIRLIEEIEKIIGKDLTWCKEDYKEDANLVIDELDSDVVMEFVQEIKNTYNGLFRNYNNFEYSDDGVFVTTTPFVEENLISLISRGSINFLQYDNKNDSFFIVGHRVKKFFSDRYGKIITTKQLLEDFESFRDNYNIIESRMRVDGKHYRGIRVDVQFLVDLLNNDLEIDESEDDVTEPEGLSPEEEEMLEKLLAKKRGVGR